VIDGDNQRTGRKKSWHYGLVADWWAEFNVDAPELDLYRPYLGEPVLDAGCGAGRLLVPLHSAGVDIDGCDVSADMVARCRERAPEATLWVSSLHELDPARRYGSIVACGVFGLGTTRAEDEEAIPRLFASLEPGGMLILDNEVPYSSPRRWGWWAEPPDLPRPWPNEAARKTCADGSEIALRSRTVAIDPLDQCTHMEMRAEKLVNGEVVATEEHALTMRMWFRDEIVMTLRHAGFQDVDVIQGVEPRILAYLARKRSRSRCRDVQAPHYEGIGGALAAGRTVVNGDNSVRQRGSG
jgi:SAM-dependent methyltransferase